MVSLTVVSVVTVVPVLVLSGVVPGWGVEQKVSVNVMAKPNKINTFFILVSLKN